MHTQLSFADSATFVAYNSSLSVQEACRFRPPRSDGDYLQCTRLIPVSRRCCFSTSDIDVHLTPGKILSTSSQHLLKTPRSRSPAWGCRGRALCPPWQYGKLCKMVGFTTGYGFPIQVGVEWMWTATLSTSHVPLLLGPCPNLVVIGRRSP